MLDTSKVHDESNHIIIPILYFYIYKSHLQLISDPRANPPPIPCARKLYLCIFFSRFNSVNEILDEQPEQLHCQQEISFSIYWLDFRNDLKSLT